MLQMNAEAKEGYNVTVYNLCHEVKDVSSSYDEPGTEVSFRRYKSVTLRYWRHDYYPVFRIRDGFFREEDSGFIPFQHRPLSSG